jgi:hypothetical protein
VAFAVTAELADIFFCKPKTTRKFRKLANNPRAAMLISNCRNQLSDICCAISVTAVGKAVEAVGQLGFKLSAIFGRWRFIHQVVLVKQSIDRDAPKMAKPLHDSVSLEVFNNGDVLKTLGLIF